MCFTTRRLLQSNKKCPKKYRNVPHLNKFYLKASLNNKKLQTNLAPFTLHTLRIPPTPSLNLNRKPCIDGEIDKMVNKKTILCHSPRL